MAQPDRQPSLRLPRVYLIGAGRAASGIGRALRAADIEVGGVASRRANPAEKLAALLQTDHLQLEALARAAAGEDALVLLAIPDAAIASVARDLAAGSHVPGHAAHLSGARDRAVLAPLAERGTITGAWHPMFAFGAGTPDLSGAACAIDAPPPLNRILTELTRALGATPVTIEARHRALYHAAAVIASNYSVALAEVGEMLLRDAHLSAPQAHAAITALLRSAVANLAAADPGDSLTGPVVRGDANTVAAHLDALSAYPGIVQQYTALARLTLALAQRSGRLDVAGADRIAAVIEAREHTREGALTS